MSAEKRNDSKIAKRIAIIGTASVFAICAALYIYYQPYCSEVGMLLSSHCLCLGKEVDVTNHPAAAVDAEPYRTRCIGFNLGVKKP